MDDRTCLRPPGCVPLALALALLLLSTTALAGDPTEALEQERLNDLALDRMLEGQARVMGITDRMRIAGAPLCGDRVRPVIGVFSLDRYTLDDLYRDKDFLEPFVDAARRRFRLGVQPRILATVPGLPADRAGMRAGDRVVAIDGRRIEKPVSLDLLRRKRGSRSMRFTIERGGRTGTVDVEAEMGCAIASRFAFGVGINAFAMSWGSSTGIYFFSGILRFMSDDDDLAIIVGHEMAHLVRGHTNQVRTSKRDEAEADYLGLYFAARAGYDISGAPEVWERFARSNPYHFIDWGFYAHPTSTRRSIELRATLHEIAAKRAQGLPLEPEEGWVSLVRPEVDETEVDALDDELRDEALQLLRSDQRRIQEVSYRLAVGGAPVCGERVAPVLGATVGRRQDFMRSQRRRVEEAFGASDEVTVFVVAESSPAARAGLREGDEILSVGDYRIKKTKHVFEQLRKSRSGPVALRIRRGSEIRKVALPRVEGCDQGTLVFASSEADTRTHKNESEMLVPTGLLRFARNDDELALAISHQMGHQLIGSFRSVEAEPRADELGLRIAALAGFDVSKAPAYWDRWASEQFWKISSEMDDTYVPHGAMSRRAPAIRAAVADLRERPPGDGIAQEAPEPPPVGAGPPESGEGD